MSKKPPRKPTPVRVSPLIAMYVPSLQPGALPRSAPGGDAAMQPLVSKTALGVTLNRYRSRCEIVYADGRTVAADGLWGLLFKMLRGASK